MKIWMFVFNNCRHDARVLKEAKTLSQAGHEVKIAALLEEDALSLEERDGFRIIRVKKSPARGPLSLLNYYRACWRLVGRSPAGVYHCHDLNTLFLGYLAVKRFGGQLVFDAHELTTELAYIPLYQKPVFKILEKYLIKKADAVIVPAPERGRFLVEKYRISPPWVILNCPPLQRETYSGPSLRARLGLLDPSVPLVVYAGGFVKGRGLENLVLAAAGLERGALVFLGWGVLEDELKNLVRQKGVQERVFFLGPVPPDELVDFISTATLGVVIYRNTGLNSYYAAPNKLYEYMQAGLPVVCSNFPTLREVVEKYAIGCTFNPEDPPGLADAINSILVDERRYAIMRQNALETAQFFNWETESGKLLEIYRSLTLSVDDTTA